MSASISHAPGLRGPGRVFMMKAKRSKSLYILLALLVSIVAIPVLVFVIMKFEGEMPALELQGPLKAIGASSTLKGEASDQKSGLKRVWIAVFQQDKERVLFDQTFPSKGFLRSGVVQSVPFSIDIKAGDLGLVDGEALLRAAAWDFSYRGWGSGNQTYEEHKILIDTKPPAIDVLSLAHNVNQGGSGLAVYRLSEPTPVNGVQVGDSFFPGYTGFSADPNLHIAFFAFPYDEKPDARLWVKATDEAGNTGQVGLAHHVNARQFKVDTIVISEAFLTGKLPEFSRLLGSPAQTESPLDIFLRVNRDLRRANHKTVTEACKKSDPMLYWQGPFLRLPASARKAGFADHRKYEYKGQIVDEQTHLGIDLASTARSPVPAANRGRVALAEYVGIYGNTVLLDHGFGIFSMYGHLASIEVQPEQVVAKGDVIGHTGSTGLAGGDHLHYAMIVGQTFVNPIEWWDPNWIRNNVTMKLEALTQGVER